MAETGPLHSTPMSRTQDQADSGVGTTQKSSQHAYDQLAHILQTPLENAFLGDVGLDQRNQQTIVGKLRNIGNGNKEINKN